jgi:hypothetical protein
MPEMQDTFNWQNESADVVEGLKFDENTDYTFRLDTVDPVIVKRKDGTVVLRNDGTPSKKLTLKWTELTTKVGFKMDLWVNDRERVNPGNPELESENVKLSRKLGYNPVLGGKFSFPDFLKVGMEIEAKLIPVTSKGKDGTEKVFMNIDNSTVHLVGEAPDTQAQIPDAPSADVVKEIQALAKGCKRIQDLNAKINKLGAKDPSKFQLLQHAISLAESGQIKFA